MKDWTPTPEEEATIHAAYLKSTYPVVQPIPGETLLQECERLLNAGFLLVYHSSFCMLAIHACMAEDVQGASEKHYHISMLLQHEEKQVSLRTAREALTALPFDYSQFRYTTEEGIGEWEKTIDGLTQVRGDTEKERDNEPDDADKFLDFLIGRAIEKLTEGEGFSIEISDTRPKGGIPFRFRNRDIEN